MLRMVTSILTHWDKRIWYMIWFYFTWLETKSWDHPSVSYISCNCFLHFSVKSVSSCRQSRRSCRVSVLNESAIRRLINPTQRRICSPQSADDPTASSDAIWWRQCMVRSGHVTTHRQSDLSMVAVWDIKRTNWRYCSCSCLTVVSCCSVFT